MISENNKMSKKRKKECYDNDVNMILMLASTIIIMFLKHYNSIKKKKIIDFSIIPQFMDTTSSRYRHTFFIMGVIVFGVL